MAKREKNYFLREFGDPNEVHFNVWDTQGAVSQALQRLGATQATKAVRTSGLVLQMQLDGFAFKPVDKKEFPHGLDLEAELGSWLEFQVMYRNMPYAAFAHYNADPDPAGKEWSESDWFISLKR